MGRGETRIGTLGLALLAWLFWQPLQAAQLLLYSEENPPLNFMRDGQPAGFSVELVQLLSARTGDAIKIELVPWTRGYAQARQQANSGLFSVVRLEQRDGLFQWVGPLMETRTRFYARRDSGLRIDSLDDARRLGRLALPRQWYSLEYLQGQGFDTIFTVTSPDKMMHMFKSQRINLIVSSEIALPYFLALEGMSPDQIEAQFSFLQHQSFLAFSQATDPAVVARWQQALEAIKADGSFTRIYQRWFSDLPLPAGLLDSRAAQR
ncbi:substrate-binding periplasmic protein [Aquipseudomonas ullengensis]|uniref:Transporter substrate-binding domain-containing protein n=1 Tax=Aquipseudomonas ullengensis TaxID=2759166 RepID=A0A7W4LI10_9GAMM|nr:transporter substrate-binding domain-containing protein [Pseudomonas ullengensis]MBB2493432.1 transporter substrate-binding domain-containing protein [Pseudomonas ullengensis]